MPLKLKSPCGRVEECNATVWRLGLGLLPDAIVHWFGNAIAYQLRLDYALHRYSGGHGNPTTTTTPTRLCKEAGRANYTSAGPTTRRQSKLTRRTGLWLPEGRLRAAARTRRRRPARR